MVVSFLTGDAYYLTPEGDHGRGVPGGSILQGDELIDLQEVIFQTPIKKFEIKACESRGMRRTQRKPQ
jgi:hypothetical protein